MSVNITKFGITSKAFGNEDISAEILNRMKADAQITAELRTHGHGDILVNERLTTIEAKLETEIKDRYAIDLMLSGQFDELYMTKARQDIFQGDSPPISNFTRVSGKYVLIKQGQIINLFLDSFVYDCTIPNDGKTPLNTQTIFEIPLSVMGAVEPGRNTPLGQVSVSIAGTVVICALRLVENNIILQTPAPVVFNGARLAIDYLPISFSIVY